MSMLYDYNKMPHTDFIINIWDLILPTELRPPGKLTKTIWKGNK